MSWPWREASRGGGVCDRPHLPAGPCITSSAVTSVAGMMVQWILRRRLGPFSSPVHPAELARASRPNSPAAAMRSRSPPGGSIAAALEARLVARGGAPRVITVEMDVDDLASVPARCSAPPRRSDRLDIVVANAGVGPRDARSARIASSRRGRRSRPTSSAPWRRSMRRSHRCERRAGARSSASPRSPAGRGLPAFSAYSAAKAGLHRYLQAVRIELHA